MSSERPERPVLQNAALEDTHYAQSAEQYMDYQDREIERLSSDNYTLAGQRLHLEAERDEWKRVADEIQAVYGAMEYALEQRDAEIARLKQERQEAVELLSYWKRLQEAERWSDVEPEWDDKTAKRDAFLARIEEEKHG